MKSIYFIGSSISSEACYGYSDVDILVFHRRVKFPWIKFNGVSVVILPYPRNGLIIEWDWNKPSALATKMFLTTPKKLILGERIEQYLRRDTRVSLVELRLWLMKRFLGARAGLESGNYRRVLKNYVKAIWAFYAYENLEPKTFTWKNMAETLRNVKPKVLDVKYIGKAIDACKKLYCCSTISFDEAYEYYDLTDELYIKTTNIYLKELKKTKDES